jgi:tellurite methyltransferase
VWACDRDANALARARALAAEVGAPADADRFRVEPIETCTFDDGAFDLVICNAVLHFAQDTAHFHAMTRRLAALVAPGGRVFCRLASTIALGAPITPLANRPARWGTFPDGHQHFLVDLAFLLEATDALGATLCDPIKTVNVQERRCMTTWVWGPA